MLASNVILSLPSQDLPCIAKSRENTPDIGIIVECQKCFIPSAKVPQTTDSQIMMQDIVNDSKGAQLDDRDTFLGVGQNRIVKWDMRDPSGVVGEMSSPVINPIGGKDYARNTNFNCMATSGGDSRDFGNAFAKMLKEATQFLRYVGKEGGLIG